MERLETTSDTVANAPVRKPRRRREPAIPRQLQRDVMEFARTLKRKYRKAFDGNPDLKVRVSRLVRAMPPPRPRPRGLPGNETITRALNLNRQLRKKYSEDTPQATWARIYPSVIPGYARMNDLEQRTAREQLQQRVAWRRRGRKKRCALAV